MATGGPAKKSGRSFMTAWAPLQIYRKYFVITSETLPYQSVFSFAFISFVPCFYWTQMSTDSEFKVPSRWLDLCGKQCPVPSSFIKLITIIRMLWVPWKVHNKFIMKWKRKLIFRGFLKLKFADFLSMSKSSFTVIYRNKIFTRNFTHNKQKMSWQ